MAAIRKSYFHPLVLSLLTACAAGATPGAARHEVAAPTPASPSAEAPAESPAAEGAAAGSTAQAASATPPAPAPAEPEGPATCPAGMQLVEGDYCTEVEQECLQSWYDESNKKTVCEVFEPKTTCVGDRVHKRFCVDTYAWPNQKGQRPEVMNRFNQAQVKCASVGKRLCTESEWTLSCEGPEMLPFPYGYVRDPRKCNGDRPWDGPDMNKVARRDPGELARLWQGVPSGSQPYCVSDYGVADLTGNNDEVVSSENFSPTWRGKFDSVHTGGPWYKGVRNQCRPKIYTHDEGFYYYFLGFRCCAEPDGKPTDPRTEKQRRADWKFERVERIAGFTRDEVAQLRAKKAKDGSCGCDALSGRRKKLHCKLICGELVGPDAQDAPQLPAEGLPPFGARDQVDDSVAQEALDAGRPARTPEQARRRGAARRPPATPGSAAGAAR